MFESGFCRLVMLLDYCVILNRSLIFPLILARCCCVVSRLFEFLRSIKLVIYRQVVEKTLGFLQKKMGEMHYAWLSERIREKFNYGKIVYRLINNVTTVIDFTA